MARSPDFSTQTNKPIMSILKIKNAAHEMAVQIVESFKGKKTPIYAIAYDDRGCLIGDFRDVFSHQGLYGFCMCKGGDLAVVYIGKSENGDRLRQHLTGKNKNGTKLETSVGNKHSKLKEALVGGFEISLCLYSDDDFDKPSLACLEIAATLYAKRDFAEKFPNVDHWNQRIG